MKRVAFLAPAAIAGIAVAAVVVGFNLSTTASYVLIGFVGFLVLSLGTVADLRRPKQPADAVELNHPAVRAEKRDSPESFSGGLPSSGRVQPSNRDRDCADAPILVATVRASSKAFFVKPRDERIDINLRIGHRRTDPIRLSV